MVHLVLLSNEMKRRLYLLKLVAVTLLTVAAGCQPQSKEAANRAERTGVPVATQAKLLEILKSADKNEGLTEAEWSELELIVASPDPKIRLEAVTALGGISKNKTTQHERINKFLTDRENDSDQKVRERAALIKKFHSPNPVPAPTQ
jgi:hypothetical protein